MGIHNNDKHKLKEMQKFFLKNSNYKKFNRFKVIFNFFQMIF